MSEYACVHVCSDVILRLCACLQRSIEVEGANDSEVGPAPHIACEEEEEGGATGDQLADEKEGEEAEKGVVKPPYSYAQLIVQALLAPRDHRQTLSGIYNFIADKYPFYRLEDKGWKVCMYMCEVRGVGGGCARVYCFLQNSIRHNLSLNQYFMKAPREKEGLGFGKGGYWCMHPDYEEKLTSQAYVKRKKKGIPVFPSAGLISK